MTETESINNSRLIPSIIITSILVLGSILSFIHIKIALSIASILFIVGHLIAIIYALVSKSMDKKEKLVILLISVFPLIFFAFMINHWPGGSILRVLMFLPIGTFIFVSFRMMNRLKYEFPFLGIMALYILLMIL